MVNMPRVSSSCDPAPSASRSLDDPEDDPEEDNPLENIESEAALRRTTSQATYSTFEDPREGTSRQPDPFLRPNSSGLTPRSTLEPSPAYSLSSFLDLGSLPHLQLTTSPLITPSETPTRGSPTRVEYTPPMLARVSAELTAQQLMVQQQQQLMAQQQPQQQDETADQDETKNNIMYKK